MPNDTSTRFYTFAYWLHVRIWCSVHFHAFNQFPWKYRAVWITTRNHLPHLMHLHLLSSKGSGAHFVRVTIIGQRVKKSRTFSQLFFLVFSEQTSAQKKSRRCGRNHHKSNGETSLTHVGSETPVTMPSVEPNPTSGSTASVTTSTSRSHVKVLLQKART